MPSNTTKPGEPTAVVERLYQATNAHDLEAIVGCFATDYRNDTPAHPDRGFTGNEQVRRNWTQILTAIPDVSARLVRSVEHGNEVWIEAEHSGTRPDGSIHQMAGVIIFTVDGALIRSARFYLEPVQHDGANADAAVAQQMRTQGVR